MSVIGRSIVLAAALVLGSPPAGRAFAQADSGSAAPSEMKSPGDGSGGSKPALPASRRRSKKPKGGKSSKLSDPNVMKKKNVTGVAHVKGVTEPVQKAP